MTRTRTSLTVALLGGAALRPLFLGAKSLWFDEASTLLLAGRPLTELPALLVHNETNPPLYYALMHVWLKAFADPRIGLRVFSALCGVASLFLFRFVAARLLPERARAPALWLAAVSSFWIHVAQDGRAYSLLLLISLASTWVVLELSGCQAFHFVQYLNSAQSGKPDTDLAELAASAKSANLAGLWAGYAGLAALGLYTHYYFAILLAGHAVWLARETKDRRGFLLAHAAAALAFAPWLGHFAAQMRTHVGDSVVGEPLTIARTLDLLGTTFFDVTFLGLVLPAWTGVAVGAGFLALAMGAAADARRSGDRRAFHFCATHLTAALALTASVELWSGRPVTQARYFTPVSPIVILLAAAALAGTGIRARLSRIAAGFVVLAGTAGYFFSALMVDPRLGALAAVIRRSSDASVPVVHLGKYYYLPMRVYYLPERRHLLRASEAAGMDFRGMPPYPGVIEDKDLPGLGPCVVVDESRTLSLERARLGTGAQLAAMLPR